MTGNSNTTPDGLPDEPVVVRRIKAVDCPPYGGWIVENRSGTGKLRAIYSRHATGDPHDPFDDRASFDNLLLLDETPLIRWHCTECPTCEQLLVPIAQSRSELTDWAERINSVTRDALISESSEWIPAISPVLNLLPPGYHLVAADEYYPTDGEGRLFWTAAGESHDCCALRQHFFHGPDAPVFLLGTQPPACFSASRYRAARESYQSRPGIALHMTGRMSALLDGHHRALAAAAAGETFTCITISYLPKLREDSSEFGIEASRDNVSPAPELSRSDADWILANRGLFPIWRNSAANTSHLSPGDAARSPQNEWTLPVELPNLHAAYPDDEAMDGVFRLAGKDRKIRDDTIEGILAADSEVIDSEVTVVDLLFALAHLRDPRLVLTAQRVARDFRWRRAWFVAYGLLAAHRCPEVDDLFVEFLVNDDGTRPEIKAIIDDYFRQEPASSGRS